MIIVGRGRSMDHLYMYRFTSIFIMKYNRIIVI